MDIHTVRQQLRTKSLYDIPLRVTYYARVSSESDEQRNSLENQIRYYEDLKLEQIAGILQENISTVKSRLYRSMKKLRIAYAGEES